VRTPPIGANTAGRMDFALSHGKDLVAVNSRDMPHHGKSRVFVSAFDGNHYLGFPLGASTPRSRFLRPDKRIVHFHQTSQLILGIPIRHGLANLVPHGPNSLVRLDPEHPLATEHRQTALLTDHHEDHPEPVHQGGPRLVEDRPCGDRDLILALTALIQTARTVEAVRAVTTSGTMITLWPSKLEQVFHTGFFSRKFPLELNKVQRLLLHCPATSQLTWGTLVIQLRSKGNNPLQISRSPYTAPRFAIRSSLPSWSFRSIVWHLSLRRMWQRSGVHQR